MVFRSASIVLNLSACLALAASAQDVISDRLKADVAALAGPEMGGRGNGQEGLEKAIGYLVDGYKSIGLQPEIQRFSYRFSRSANDGPDSQLSNVIVAIQGSDPALKSQHIVVGAHLDHLGTRTRAGGAPVIYFGADDNASGTAAVVELVRHFRNNPPARTLLFIHFTGEEWGLLGSKYWIANPTVDIGSVRFMANLDMIGRFDPGKATLAFTAMGMGPDGIAKAKAMAPRGVKLEADRGTSIFSSASDHAPFAANNIPTFFLFTGIHADYHRPTDTIDKINWDGLAAITQFAQSLIAEYATMPNVPEYQHRANLGMAAEPGEKASVLRVYQGGSAESAGLKRGDLLKSINGHKVESAENLERVLDLFNRGDKVKLIWERGKTLMEAEVVLQ